MSLCTISGGRSRKTSEDFGIHAIVFVFENRLWSSIFARLQSRYSACVEARSCAHRWSKSLTYVHVRRHLRLNVPQWRHQFVLRRMAWLAEAAQFDGLEEFSWRSWQLMPASFALLCCAVHKSESLPQLAALLVGIGYSEKLADCILMCDLPVERGFWG